MCHQIFEESFLNCFLLTSTVFFHTVHVFIFFASRDGPDLGIFAGEHKRGGFGGSNLDVNYDSAYNKQKKGVS